MQRSIQVGFVVEPSVDAQTPSPGERRSPVSRSMLTSLLSSLKDGKQRQPLYEYSDEEEGQEEVSLCEEEDSSCEEESVSRRCSTDAVPIPSARKDITARLLQEQYRRQVEQLLMLAAQHSGKSRLQQIRPQH